MKTNLICSGIVMFLMAGCAKRPDAIVPIDIPMAAYGNLDCKGIANETIVENGKLASLSKSQNEAATADAVGVFLIGAPLGSVTGGDKEGQIAVSKGKIQALESSAKAKGCQ